MSSIARRSLLKSGLALSASCALPSLCWAAAPGVARKPGQKVLVTVFQRFGMDGVLAVAPYTDKGLAKLRPDLVLSPPSSRKANARLDLGAGFGLHPAFAPLLPLYQQGHLAIVHGIGQPDNTRAHLTAQRWWESGVPGDPNRHDGWLNRALTSMGELAGPTPAVALAQSRPFLLYGSSAVTTTTDLESLTPAARSATLLEQLKRRYEQSPTSPLRDAALQGIALSAALTPRAQSAVDYPEGSQLGKSLQDLARLIKADVGVRVGYVESKHSPNGKGTWDTHSNASTVAADGPFPQMATDLASSLAAFMQDLGPRQSDVVVVTLTDFGRNVVQNDKLGADHGRGTAMFVLGGPVAGGQVYGTLPERFERDALEDGMDLPVTTDFRSVLSPIVQAQLGLADTTLVFPDWNGPSRPVLRT